SSVKFSELGELEDQVKTLWSPLWPDDFPKIDRVAAAKGAQLYRAKCVECHKPIDRKDPSRSVRAVMDASGTDSRAFDNFFVPRRPSGKLAGVNVNFIPFSAKIPPEADANTMLSNVVIGVILGRFKDAPPDELDQVDFRGEDLAAFAPGANRGAKYKARP